MKKLKTKMTTSKKLTWVVTIVWTISIFLSYTGVLLFDKDTSFILATVSSAFAICLSGYFTKAFLETKEEEKNKLLQQGLTEGTINLDQTQI